ncbi:MAG: twin-arginine translocase subunit TatC [Myxococcota bacterium]|nr:twin-arginine translocase subunit TatC [Myxococcota bacterium]
MAREQSELDASRAPFLDHLGELRIRIWWAVVAVFVCACACFVFSDFLGAVIMEPIIVALKAHGQQPTLASRTVQGGFLFSFKVAIIFGVFCAIPVVLYQLWQFIAPGLYKHERRFALPFVVLSTLCFAGGGFFAYYFVLPAVFDFLIGYSVDMGQSNLKLDITIEDSLGFTTKLLLAFGIVFELPVAVAFLSWIGMVTHVGLMVFWRWAVVIAFILGAALTPPDLVSQLFLAVPLVTLYGISIGIAYVITKRREGGDGDEGGDDDGGPNGHAGPGDGSNDPSGGAALGLENQNADSAQLDEAFRQHWRLDEPEDEHERKTQDGPAGEISEAVPSAQPNFVDAADDDLDLSPENTIVPDAELGEPTNELTPADRQKDPANQETAAHDAAAPQKATEKDASDVDEGAGPKLTQTAEFAARQLNMPFGDEDQPEGQSKPDDESNRREIE